MKNLNFSREGAGRLQDRHRFTGRVQVLALPGDGVQTVNLSQTGDNFDAAVPGVLREGWVLSAITEAGYGRRDEIS
jgi:hypothetical protein